MKLLAVALALVLLAGTAGFLSLRNRPGAAVAALPPRATLASRAPVTPTQSRVVATPTSAPATPLSNSAVPTPTSAPGTQPIFDDEFNGSALDMSQWIAVNRPGDSSNSEQECYLPSRVGEGGGILTLTSALDNTCAGYAYTSAMVQTRAFHFLYGTVVIRAKMPHGQGMWPGLWLLGANCQGTNPTTPDNTGACQWPTPGSDEVDILELKGQQPTVDYMTVHYGNVPNQDTSAQCTYAGPDFSQGFHTFTLNWEPGKLTWYVDGAQTCVQTVGVPSHPLFLIMNDALGGDFVGGVDKSVLPQTLLIDYVRVYQ